MGLYLVNVSVDFMVRADSWNEAWQNARSYVRDSVDGDGFEIDGVNEVERIEDVPEEWRNALPWGTPVEDEATCAQLMGRVTNED